MNTIYIKVYKGVCKCDFFIVFLDTEIYIDKNKQLLQYYTQNPSRGCPRGVMVKAVGCGIVVSEFVLKSRYYVPFLTNTPRKGMNPLILPAMGWIVTLLFFLKEGFGIK